MIPRDVTAPTIPIPFHKLLKVVAVVDETNPQTKELLSPIAAENFEIEVSGFDRDMSEDASVGAYVALIDGGRLEGIKGRISATLALIYPPGIGVVLPGERWDERAQPMLDYFLAFQDSFNRLPGFDYEVQGVFQERLDGRIKFYTYVVRG
jgi:arginine/lysine/ornithine decarboxylase